MYERFDHNGKRLLVSYDLTTGLTMMTPEGGSYTSSFEVTGMPLDVWRRINAWVEEAHAKLSEGK